MPIDFQHSLPSRIQNAPSENSIHIRRQPEQSRIGTLDRLEAIESTSHNAQTQVIQLLGVALRGLPRMHKDGIFGHTLRAVKTGSHWSERLEGDSLRYASIAALGLSYADEAIQHQILNGSTASELAQACAARAETSADTGAVALASWAAAEAGRFHAAPLFRKLHRLLASDAPIATVHCAWTLTAALAAEQLNDTQDVVSLATQRLLSELSPTGLFPHMLPASASGRLRAHIGCLADQVYTIQALSRLHVARENVSALSAAEACAQRICALQGPAGQWWWYYDTRDGNVVEGYPVYSVHQHAMAPMALLDLREAGGSDHFQAIAKGLRWLDEHPEVAVTLVIPEKGVIWRKVARREPRKAMRAISAITTALAPGLHIPALDAVFPANQVDFECRPYELGWLLYAWLSGGVVARLAPGSVKDTAAPSKEI
ncbi:hypothetical protein LJR255_004955 [Pararhizobium sp. LjRoot255]|uniref:hypothetical protein n=1 Tax=Pararhizobium sp. LjRoot255 TaxID=3342298 RepID=UPI003ECDCFFE